MYDSHCYDLAARFLEDEKTLTEPARRQHVDRLAQVIQDAIENYLAFDVRAPMERPPVNREPT